MLKTCTFALMHFSITFSVAYLLTGSWWVGGLIACVEPAVNTVGYVIHERLWQQHLLRQGIDESMTLSA